MNNRTSPQLSTQAMIYACTLAQTLNFHDAAKQCHTSQPNLSTQIKNVEKELKSQLFERSKRGVLLTANGKKIIERFEKILNDLQTLHDYSDEETQNHLEIGLFPTLAPYLLPSLMKTLKEKMPDLNLVITEDKTERITQKLIEGELDCILAAYPLPTEDLEHMILFEDVFLVAMPADHPLASKETLKINDLKKERILLLEEGHCLRDQSLEVCHNKALAVDSSYKASSLETLRAMVAGGAGITFIPQLCVDDNPLLKYVPITPTLSRTIALFCRPTSRKKSLFHPLANAVLASRNFTL